MLFIFRQICDRNIRRKAWKSLWQFCRSNGRSQICEWQICRKMESVVTEISHPSFCHRLFSWQIRHKRRFARDLPQNCPWLKTLFVVVMIHYIANGLIKTLLILEPKGGGSRTRLRNENFLATYPILLNCRDCRVNPNTFKILEYTRLSW